MSILKRSVLFLFCVLLSTGFVLSFEPTLPSENAIYNARLIPAPRTTQFGQGVIVFNKNLKCILVLPEEIIHEKNTKEFINTTSKVLTKWFNIEIIPELQTPEQLLKHSQQNQEINQTILQFAQSLNDDNDNFFLKKNASQILAVPDKSTAFDLSPEEIASCRDDSRGTLIIAGSDQDGIRDAFKTLIQLSETFGITENVVSSCHFIPELLVKDWPEITFRGLHLCWFPETSPAKIEQSIRIAAYYKFNYIILEFWGTFPFESTSVLSWSDFQTSKDEIHRLVHLGRELGVKLIPQMNLFGHATAARVSVGKHTTLDFHPEYEPLFEPDGWTWNIYNPDTRKLLTQCVLELYEAFESPEFFHLGFDEAYSAGTGFLARRKGNYIDVLAEWLTYFHDLFFERNCRVMIWHDMLVDVNDFNGYTAGGNTKTRDLINKLPKDILICDWQYSAPKENENWPTTQYFKDKGYEFISCPWRNTSGIISLAQNVSAKEGFGLLCTTWHRFYGESMRNILTVGSGAAWGTTYRGSSMDKILSFNRHLRQASRDIPNKTYRTNGVTDLQVLPNTVGSLD